MFSYVVSSKRLPLKPQSEENEVQISRLHPSALHMGLDYMVAQLGLRTHELLYEEICNIIADILSVREKAGSYEEGANHAKPIFTLIHNNIFWGFLHL